MTKKISLEYFRHGQRYAIDRLVDEDYQFLVNVPLMTIRIGFESITIPRLLLTEMCSQLEMAEATGSQYPEDLEALAKAGYGLARDSELNHRRNGR